MAISRCQHVQVIYLVLDSLKATNAKVTEKIHLLLHPFWLLFVNVSALSHKQKTSHRKTGIKPITLQVLQYNNLPLDRK